LRVDFICIALFLSNYLQAQITVTNSIFTQAGDILTVSIDTVFNSLPTPGSAINQNWDFSDLNTDYIRIDTIQAASSGPSFANFPGTEILQSFFNFGQSYTNVNTSNVERVGADINIGFAGLDFVAPYSDPHITQVAPLSFGTMQSDQFLIKYTAHIDSTDFVDSLNPLPISPDSIRVRIEGDQIMQVEAYGSCFIHGTNLEVLRQKVEVSASIMIDLRIPTTGNNGVWQDVTQLLTPHIPIKTNQNQIYYDYLLEGIKEPLVRTVMNSSQTSIEKVEFKGPSFLSTKTTSDNLLSIFPNPAKEFIVFKGNFLVENIEYVELIDLSGNVFFKSSKPSNKHQQIDLTGIPPGYYLVNVYSSDSELKYQTKLVIVP
jgi:hypothetical protein